MEENNQSIKKFEKDINIIVVDDGLVNVPICNKKNEKIGVFSFRPTDIGIIDRFNEAMAEFENVVKPLENININPDGTTNADEFSALHEAEKRLYEVCDKIFGGNMAEAFFGKMHPFSIVNGRFYCENALEGVGNYISKRFDRETKKVNNRIEKYTHGYKTGKHKGGKR